MQHRPPLTTRSGEGEEGGEFKEAGYSVWPIEGTSNFGGCSFGHQIADKRKRKEVGRQSTKAPKHRRCSLFQVGLQSPPLILRKWVGGDRRQCPRAVASLPVLGFHCTICTPVSGVGEGRAERDVRCHYRTEARGEEREKGGGVLPEALPVSWGKGVQLRPLRDSQERGKRGRGGRKDPQNNNRGRDGEARGEGTRGQPEGRGERWAEGERRAEG